jgi:hypothetical protein
VGGCGEARQFVVSERGGDEEDGIGAMSASFDDLIVVDDEVLAEAGNAGGGGGSLKVGKAALEERLVGEDGKGSGSGGFEG